MTINEINNLKIGRVLNSLSLRDIFQVSNQGGMRGSHKTNSLVLISNHFSSQSQKTDENAKSENVYTDEWKDGIFHYTGMGLKGNQDKNYMQNRTINESSSNGVNLYLFEVFSKGYFTFSGKVELSGEPYVSFQEDVTGKLREVWIFPLRKSEKKHNSITLENIVTPKMTNQNKNNSKQDEPFSYKDNKISDDDFLASRINIPFSSPPFSPIVLNHLLECNILSFQDLDKLSRDEINDLLIQKKGKVRNQYFSGMFLKEVYQYHGPLSRLKIKDKIQKSLNSSINFYQINERTKNIIKNYNYTKLGHLAQLTEFEILNLKNAGRVTVTEINNYLIRNDIYLGLLDKNVDWETPEEELLKNENLISKLNTIINIDILSVRARNILRDNDIKKFGHLAQLTESKLLKFRNSGIKTLKEIHDLLHEKELYFGMNLKNIEWELNEIPEEISVLIDEDQRQYKKYITDILEFIFENHGNKDQDKSRDKIVFEKRLQEITLQEIADDLSITRERVRQIEARIFNSLLSHLNTIVFKNEIDEFHKKFSLSKEPIHLYDVINTIKTFKGIEALENPEIFIKKITEFFSKINNTASINYDKIPGIINVFYSKTNNSIPYDELLKKIKGIHKESMLNGDQDPSQNEKITIEILEVNREDIREIVISNLKDFSSESLNLSQKLILYFKKQNNLVSVDQASADLGLGSRFGNLNFLNNNEIYEFKRGGWGESKKFYLFREGYEEIVTDRIIDAMKENPSKQYKANKLLDIITLDLNYLSDFPKQIDEYQMDVCLTKASKLGKPIYDLGRRYWSLEKAERKNTKHIVYQILYDFDKPSQYSELISEINKIKDVDSNFVADDNLEYYGGNYWGLMEWRNSKPDSFFNQLDVSLSKRSRISKDDLIDFVERYVAEHGNLIINTFYIENNKNFGNHIYELRRKYEKNLLSDDKIKELERINGWTWHIFRKHNSIEMDDLLDFIKEYGRENGNLNIPYRYTKDGKNYGGAIYRIRKKYKTQKNLPEKIKILEEIPEWQWENDNNFLDEGPGNKRNRKVSEYKVNITLLNFVKKYTEENGNCNISSGFIKDGIPFGSKIYLLRRKYRSGNLHQDEINEYEKINGWSWENSNQRRTISSDEFKIFCEKYFEINGDLNFPSNYKEDGKSYGHHRYNWIKNYHNKKLSKEKIKDLENIKGWDWTFFSSSKKVEKLDFIIKYLKEFQKENNHCDIKFKTKTANGYTIGRWVDRTRRKFRNNELEPSLVEILEGIDGWVWSSGNKRGGKDPVNIENLKNFIINYSKENGNINIPASYLSNGENYGGRIYRLRQRYASGSLDQASIDTMEEIEGWEWEHHKKFEKGHSTEEAVTAIKKFQKREGHLNIPVGHLEDDVNIYQYKFSKISRYKTNKLSDKIISLLEEVPGWKW